MCIRVRAAFAGQLPCVRALLAAGAKHSAADASFLDMKTPLHKAAGQGHRDVCIALMEAGADPNTRDAAGNTVLDVLDLASPTLSNAALLLAPQNKGGGTEACSTVVLSSGEDQDWSGAREALERYGGCGCHGCDGDGSSACGSPSTSSGGLEQAGPEQESARVPPAVASAPKVAVGTGAGVGVGVEEFEEASAEPTICCTRARDTPSEVSSKGHLADTPRSDRGSDSMGAGIPCCECLLPNMVMVRASCCGGLLCKPCVRKICARRHSCRRCRDAT